MWMSRLSAALKSSIGSKVVMALTGLGLVLYVILHMAGNLQLFIGQDAINNYGVTLRKVPLLLWIARIGLLGMAILHVIISIRLKLANWGARPVRYQHKNTVRASLNSRLMIVSGLVVLAFVIYHLLHFTFGVTDPQNFALHDSQGRHDIYNMVVNGFQNPVISGGYILAMVLLFSHLGHGASSWMQSLGWNHPKYNGIIEKVGPVISWIVCLGFIAVPLGVLFGIIKPEGGM
jgi:succinate dehydrogenase / fumarate reductase cytochrome b subunit